MQFAKLAAFVLLAAPLWSQNTPPVPKDCDKFTIDDHGSTALVKVPIPPAAHTVCQAKTVSGGRQVPDPACTPGAINPTLTQAVLKDPAFRTSCVRNDATTEKEKQATYKWYKAKKPRNNTGSTQTCELDHLIPLYLGGADTLENIWPQCGPPGVHLDDRFFKEKDKVEYYLGQQVREGKMDLAAAQKGIAEDWTKFLDDAASFCKSGKCDFTGN